MSNRIMPISYESTIINYLNGVNATARVDGILPKQTNTNKTTNIQTKKLAQIIITNKGKIDFTNESGREDTNMSSGSKLKKIEIKDHLNNLIKEFNFNYDYLNYTPLQGAVKKRLLLSEVIEKPSVGTEQLKHKFSYKNKSVHETYVLFDKWGYPTNSGMYTPDPTYYDATGVLQKVTYPTGGCAIYDFGSNTYSYIGSESITDFSSNPENWIFSTQYKGPISSSSNLSTKEISLGINLNTVKYLKYSFVMSGLPDDGFISLKRKNLNGTFSNVDFVDSEWIILPGYEHVILFSWLNNSYSGTLSLTLNYRSVKSNPLQYLKGGGVRINRIGYFDIDVEQDYYQNFSYYSNSNIIPSKEKNFNYNFFNSSKTSGSLVFPVPLYSYEVSHPAKSPHLLLTNLNYLTTTDYNNLQTVRTHGSDVGYKNVTVSEKDNGKTEFTYRTPIDYPEDHYTTSYPFIPSINRDYKRGQAVKETQYMKKNTTFFPISETDYVYEIDSLTVVTGIRGNNVSKCPKASEFTYYSEFIHCLNMPGCDHSWAFCNADYFLSFHTIFDSYGWSRLVSKTRKEFFYEPSQKVMQSSEFYTYNILNKKVSSHTVVNTTNDQIKTDYFYHVGNSFYTKNRVSEISHIHSYKNSELISVDKIIYSNAFLNNTSFLPEKIEKSKGSNALETKIRYNRYDEYGNVLEVQQENGMKISYIWGYSHTQPVAKIENMAYASIPTQLITNIHSASTETSLQTALTALRTNLTTAMVTTYTYIPLVGISTVTDPKGYTTTYTYDNFGRLATVKDADGKLLTTHEYNYRP